MITPIQKQILGKIIRIFVQKRFSENIITD